jgi:hypothetical protein
VMPKTILFLSGSGSSTEPVLPNGYCASGSLRSNVSHAREKIAGTLISVVAVV